MPWFPEFASAAELAREQTRAAGRADPVRQYLSALNDGDARDLETTWPGEVVIYDPHAGEVRGHRHVRQFVKRNVSWLAGLHARTEVVASTVAGGRAVVELLAHVDHNGQQLAWPVAVVAESPDDQSVVFRTYCSQWPLDEKRPVRPPILAPGPRQPGRRGQQVPGRAGRRGTRTRWCARSRPTGTFKGRSARATRTAAPPSSARSSTAASAQAAASAWRAAP